MWTAVRFLWAYCLGIWNVSLLAPNNLLRPSISFWEKILFIIIYNSKCIILIESSYNITTGSGQSKRADQLVEFYGALMRHNANHRANKIIMLNYCDGFGWVGRQNDLHRIYDASDFVFNQRNLNVLDEVLNEYYPMS